MNNYGMYADNGNKKIETMINGLRDNLYDEILPVFSVKAIAKFATDFAELPSNPLYSEAGDTMVREIVYGELEAIMEFNDIPDSVLEWCWIHYYE